MLEKFVIILNENMQKPAKKEILSETVSTVFGTYFNTLGAIFRNNAVTADQTEYELKKDELIGVLKEIALLEKEPMATEYTANIINDSVRIRHDNLLFNEMLEVIYRVAQACPISEETAGTPKEVKKLTYVLDKLQIKNAGDAEKFGAEIEEAKEKKGYLMKYLVPEVNEVVNALTYPPGNEEAEPEEEDVEEEVEEEKA